MHFSIIIRVAGLPFIDMPLIKIFLPPSGPVLSTKVVADAACKHFQTSMDNVQVLAVRLPTDEAAWPPCVFFDVRAKKLASRTAPGALNAFEAEMKSMVAQHYSGWNMQTKVRIELFEPALKVEFTSKL
jgi:hypothetical protein